MSGLGYLQPRVLNRAHLWFFSLLLSNDFLFVIERSVQYATTRAYKHTCSILHHPEASPAASLRVSAATLNIKPSSLSFFLYKEDTNRFLLLFPGS